MTIPLNGKQLAEAIGRSQTYVIAMKKVGGYKFSHGNRSLPNHALKWIADHPEFRVSSYNQRWAAASALRNKRDEITNHQPDRRTSYEHVT